MFATNLFYNFSYYLSWKRGGEAFGNLGVIFTILAVGLLGFVVCRQYPRINILKTHPILSSLHPQFPTPHYSIQWHHVYFTMSATADESHSAGWKLLFFFRFQTYWHITSVSSPLSSRCHTFLLYLSIYYSSTYWMIFHLCLQLSGSDASGQLAGPDPQ